MPEASFRRQCQTTRQATTPHSSFGGRRPLNDHCQKCQGEPLPPGLEFITLAEMVALAGSVAEASPPPPAKNKENVMSEDKKPATFADLIPQSGRRPPQLDKDVFWALPAGRITLSGLRGYWANPPLIGRRRGLCPACLVTDQRCKANGVCVTCYDTLHKLTGQALIEAIADAPARKQRALARQAPGRSGLVLQPPDPPPEEPGRSDIPADTPGPEDYLTAHQPPPAADYIADNTMANAITAVCMDLCEFLLAKNKSYGNSAANPLRIFSQADPIEQINVRIDDKLSRLMRGTAYPGDDTELDLMGYLALKRAIIYRNNAEGKTSGGDQGVNLAGCVPPEVFAA